MGANKGVLKMEKFKVKKKHLTGEIADFPRRVVQEMVDEQVRQGNPADPSVFARRRTACNNEGGFTWLESTLVFSWAEIIREKKFHLIPKRQSIAPEMAGGQNSDECVEPHAIIQHMLDKGMYSYRVTRYDTDKLCPVRTRYASWKCAVPIDTATMTEITEVPK